MKLLKFSGLALAVSLMTGCANNTLKNINEITVTTPMKEAITILDQRGRLNDSLCVSTSISIECELLGYTVDDPNHQFMRFDMYPMNGVTNITVSRWITTNGSNNKKMLDLSNNQLNAISAYIEEHTNRLKEN